MIALPSDPPPRAELDRVATALNAWDELVQTYEAAIEKVKDEDPALVSELLSTIARIHDERRGDPRSAIVTYERLIAHDANDASPLDALELAIRYPDKQVVFFAVGFETTAPANAMAVWRARELNVRNFTVLVSHVTVPPAMTALLEAPDNRVQAFLAAGHVCTVMGWTEYEPIARRYWARLGTSSSSSVSTVEQKAIALK